MKNQMYSLSANERGMWKKILLIKRKKIVVKLFFPLFPTNFENENKKEMDSMCS